VFHIYPPINQSITKAKTYRAVVEISIFKPRTRHLNFLMIRGVTWWSLLSDSFGFLRVTGPSLPWSICLTVSTHLLGVGQKLHHYNEVARCWSSNKLADSLTKTGATLTFADEPCRLAPVIARIRHTCYSRDEIFLTILLSMQDKIEEFFF